MQHWFLDTNILVDYLAKRAPFFALTEVMFEAAAVGQVRLYCSTHSFATAHYLLSRSPAVSDPIDALRLLRTLVVLLPITEQVIDAALRAPSVDFEDTLQYLAAEAFPSINLIVTRDPRGFRDSPLPAYLPQAALHLLL